jgi:hypothetical protein
MKRTRNLLLEKEQKQLRDWLESVWEGIKSTKPTRYQVAKDASKALGFSVTGGNILGAAKEIGKSMPFPRNRKQMITNLAIIEYPGPTEIFAQIDGKWYKVNQYHWADPVAVAITQEAAHNGTLPIQDPVATATAQGETAPFIKPPRPTQPPTGDQR